MTEHAFCGNCDHLSITEEQQDLDKLNGTWSGSHICNLFQQRVKHGKFHPMLPRLGECIEMYGIESLP